MNNFKELDFSNFKCNPFLKIGSEWMLVTAGNKEKLNTMTASWGALGVMWGKNVTFTFIRPQRYTKEFIDACDTYSLSFFNKDYKKTLSYLGTATGRNENKINASGLTPYFFDGVPSFAESDLVLICKKLYKQDLSPKAFLDNTLDSKWYPQQDYHCMYVSEIVKIFSSK